MNTPQVSNLVARGAIFYVSHSGGKDSQAMYAKVRGMVPHDQIVVVHADLGEVEWEGVQDHIRATISHPLNVVRAGKTFFDMVRHRARTRPDVPAFPSSKARQCTSDLKRDPIAGFIRRDMKARGATLAINVMGLRAEESSARAKKAVWAANKRLSKAGRTVYDWNPIHAMLELEVFATIHAAGQEPFWAYAAGNKRLSCVFCIMGCASDLANGKRHRPELYEAYTALERETGWTLFQNQSLAERIAEAAPASQPETESRWRPAW